MFDASKKYSKPFTDFDQRCPSVVWSPVTEKRGIAGNCIVVAILSSESAESDIKSVQELILVANFSIIYPGQ